jgi:hypothetical protein
LIIAAAGSLTSKGTDLGCDLAQKLGKSLLVVDVVDPNELGRTVDWLSGQLSVRGKSLALGIGGPRESEASGIYAKTVEFLHSVLSRLQY